MQDARNEVSFTSRFFGEGGKVAQNGRKEDVREIVLIR